MNADLWNGPVRAALRPAPDHAMLPFGAYYDPAELPFELVTLPAEGAIDPSVLDGVSVVLAGDMYNQYGLLSLRSGSTPAICFIAEHNLKNRLRMTWQSQSSVVRRLKTTIWMVKVEQQRIRAIKNADGLQANGVNAYNRYKREQANTILFFDTRMSEKMMATKEDMLARAERLRNGAPLRLMFSGRLDAIKGVDHLPAVAAQLKSAGVRFTLDIFGTGRLGEQIAADISERGLQDEVRLRGGVDFETELAPFVRRQADIFVCCHRQSDPSCTYLETYGGGAPIVGYDNAAFQGLKDLSGAGWPTPMDRSERIAAEIVRLDSNRAEIIEHADKARAFAGDHSLEKTFERRLRHLESLAASAANEKMS